MINIKRKDEIMTIVQKIANKTGLPRDVVEQVTEELCKVMMMMDINRLILFITRRLKEEEEVER